MSDMNELLGKTLVAVERQGDRASGESLEFVTDAGERFRMFHSQDCCESVTIEDIAGDLADLIGSPITKAEEVVSENQNPPGVTPPEFQDSFTWTFYHFATAKGYVTVRWYGESNGYYSESVDFVKVPAMTEA
jgi:hypothetical protein